MNENWQQFNLSDIADPLVKYSLTGGPFGSDLKSSEYTSNGVRIIQLQNIGDGFFKNDYKIYTSKEKADYLFASNIYGGEIIMSKMGDPVARATLVPDSLGRCVMASDGIRLKVDETNFDKKFILSCINASYFRQQAIGVSTGTTRKRIGLTSLRNLKLYVPSLPEQKKISEIISCFDKLIDLYESSSNKKDLLASTNEGKINKLKFMRLGVLEDLLSGRKRVNI